MIASFTKLVLMLVCLGLTSGEVVNTKKCPARSGSPVYCQVHEVRVSPCPAAAQHRPCEIRWGNNYSIAFDFTPNFDATSMDNFANLVGGKDGTKSWDLLEKDACKYTKCPLEAGKRYTYTYTRDPNAPMPPDTDLSTVKWLIVKSGEYEKQCCFQIKFNYYTS